MYSVGLLCDCRKSRVTVRTRCALSGATGHVSKHTRAAALDQANYDLLTNELRPDSPNHHLCFDIQPATMQLGSHAAMQPPPLDCVKATALLSLRSGLHSDTILCLLCDCVLHEASHDVCRSKYAYFSGVTGI